MKFDQARGEVADEGVAGAGAVDDLDAVAGEAREAMVERDEAAARAEGDDDGGNAETSAALLERSVVEAGEGGFVDGFAGEAGQGGEFGFVGNEHIDVAEDGGVEVGAHRGGIENRRGAGATGGAEDVGVGREAGLMLGDDDSGAAEPGRGNVAGRDLGAGADGDDDLVAALAIDHDGGGAGGVAFFDDEARIDSFGVMERAGAVAEGVVADGADETCGDAGAGGSDGLIRALAARAEGESAECGFAGSGKVVADENEILHETTNDDDEGLHRRRR